VLLVLVVVWYSNGANGIELALLIDDDDDDDDDDGRLKDDGDDGGGDHDRQAYNLGDDMKRLVTGKDEDKRVSTTITIIVVSSHHVCFSPLA